MNDPLILALATLAGGVLGVVFFGGLWWSLRKGLSSTQPARWFVVSRLLRTSVVLIGFYVVGSGQSERLLMCLLGFVAARVIVTKLIQSPVQRPMARSGEASHAP